MGGIGTQAGKQQLTTNGYGNISGVCPSVQPTDIYMG